MQKSLELQSKLTQNIFSCRSIGGKSNIWLLPHFNNKIFSLTFTAQGDIILRRIGEKAFLIASYQAFHRISRFL